MKVSGVDCEYNPFHRGQLLQLNAARAALGGENAIVCVMSGDFVQRGEGAVYDKFARAEAACRCGADLVVELPLPWSIASAEGFARGAVSLLGALGVSNLSFGSETGDTESLLRLSETLADPTLQEEIRELMRREGNLSYAAARERAAALRLGTEAVLLRGPNDILGAEYLKAIRQLGLRMEPLVIRRQGAGHDQPGSGEGPCSASELRRRIRAGEASEGEIPPEAAAVFDRERERGRELAGTERLELALLSRLRLLEKSAFEALPDGGDGLGLRLWHAVQEEAGLEEILLAAKSKRYPHARLRRMALAAALGLQAENPRGLPPYARVLAFNHRGRELLGALDSALPVLIKPAAVRKLPEEVQRVFTLGAAAHDLYTLALPAWREIRPGEDWRRGPTLC